jgi:hypothetical protein
MHERDLQLLDSDEPPSGRQRALLLTLAARTQDLLQRVAIG